jgi:hypothetical protein
MWEGYRVSRVVCSEKGKEMDGWMDEADQFVDLNVFLLYIALRYRSITGCVNSLWLHYGRLQVFSVA